LAAQTEARILSRIPLLLLLIVTLTGQGQAERLPIRTYTINDGLARDQINRIVKDSRGFLWFCTSEGISRFDGYNFNSYTIEDGLPHRRVTDLLETGGGVYWVATAGGVCRFDSTISSRAETSQLPDSPRGQNISVAREQRFVVYATGEDGRARYVNQLLADSAGAIWCGTDGGVYRLERQESGLTFSYVDIGLPAINYDDRTVSTILEDSRGGLCFGTKNGLYRRLADGRVERYTTRDGLPFNDIRSLFEDNEGRLWVGTTLGLCHIVFQSGSSKPLAARVYKAKEGLLHPYINCLFQAADGKLWIGSGGGLHALVPSVNKEGGKLLGYTTDSGLSSNSITALAEDKDGNLWIGSSSGAMKMARNGLVTYKSADGIANPSITSILENEAGELCVIDGKGSINRFDGKRFISTIPNMPKGVNATWGVQQIQFQDHTGRWWVPTLEGLLLYPKVSRVEQLADTLPEKIFTTADGLAGNQIFRLYEDTRGDVWISTLDSQLYVLTRWERATGKFHSYSQAYSQSFHSSPTAFCEDRQGNMWIGFYLGGLARYRNGRFTPFTTEDGLPAGTVGGLFCDRRGILWIATAEGGLARVDDPGADSPRFVRYSRAEGLASNHASCITEDRWGRIYIGTGRGLDRLDPSSGRINHYTVADGLGHNLVISAFRDRSGALWFGTADGLSRFMPEPDQPRPPSPVFISGLRIPGLSYPVSDLGETEIPRLELNANQNQIEIDFFGLSFSHGEALHYQYKLEGSDRDWRPPTSARTVNYASLSPGAYRFLVRALGADGAFSQSPATVDFTILPPVWRRWWFMALAAMLIGGIIIAFDRYRSARVRAIKESEDRFRTLAETASDAIITIDERSHIIFVNPAAENVFGYQASQMLGQDLTMLMPEYLRHLHKRGFGKYVETGKRHLSWEAIELPGLHKSGREIPLEISFGEFTLKNKHFFTGVARDITERKRAEEALRKSREERLVELEHVRRRIATDLHDDIGSSLSQIYLLSEVARQRVGRNDRSATEPLSMIASASHDLVASMSDIVWAINPHKDHLSDLVQRMRRFASDVLSARNIEFHFLAPGAEDDIRLGASIRREVFLIFKESVNNIARHSGCRAADIEFILAKDSIALRLSDDGKGFDLFGESDGHGLFSMRERAKAIGAEFEMASSVGHGTTTTLKVPLDQSSSSI
jgi:PAS domain S-box-containing protein